LAAVLDELARHLRDFDDDVRCQVLQTCRTMLGEMLIQE
jgi:hypothetical protein